MDKSSCNHGNVTRGGHSIGSAVFGVTKCNDCGLYRVDGDPMWVEVDSRTADLHVLALVVQSLLIAEREARVIR